MIASFLGAPEAAVIVAVVGGFVTWLGQRTRKEISQINKAVNHQAEGEPTLIQRVIRLEQNQSIHTAWTAEALRAVATQIGAKLPEKPESIVDYDELKPGGGD